MFSIPGDCIIASGHRLGGSGGALYIGNPTSGLAPINILAGYLPITGGTLSGNLLIEKNSSWAGLKTTRTDNSLYVQFGIDTDDFLIGHFILLKILFCLYLFRTHQ